MGLLSFLSAPSLTQIDKLLESRLVQIINYLTLMPTNAEFTASIKALTEQVTKSKSEIVKRISELEAAVSAGGTTSPEVDTAFAALKAEVQGVDDLHPDATA